MSPSTRRLSQQMAANAAAALDSAEEQVGYLWKKYQQTKKKLKHAVSAGAEKAKAKAKESLKKISQKATRIGREVILPKVKEVAADMSETVMQVGKRKAQEVKQATLSLGAKFWQLTKSVSKSVSRHLDHEKNKLLAKVAQKVRSVADTVQKGYKQAVRERQQQKVSQAQHKAKPQAQHKAMPQAS